MVTFEQMRSLLGMARHELIAQFGVCGPVPHGNFEGMAGGFVNITVRQNGRVVGSMGGSGSTLPEAVRLAMQRASRDERFGSSVLRGDLDCITIELWIEEARAQLTGDPTGWTAQMRLGWDGIMISRGMSSAYYKPSVALTKSVPTVEELLGKLCRKANLPENAWQESETRVERTNWIHAVEGKSSVVLLEGLRAAPSRRAEPDTILAAAESSLSRLLAIQKADGSFGYLYHPFDDKWDRASHSVRLAGCAYALARAAAHPVFQSNSNPLVSPVNRIATHLLGYATRLNGLTFIREPGDEPAWGKLGATALTALAAQYTPEPFGEAATDLIETLMHLQDGDGRFSCGIGREEGPTAQNFFPGEAILALVCNLMQTSDSRIIRILSRAFYFYKRHFYADPTSAFVVWHTIAWTRLASWLSDNQLDRLGSDGPSIAEMRAFVLDQIDWLIEQQHTKDTTNREEYVGGFKVPTPPSASSAAFIEAVNYALRAAKLAGDDLRLLKYRESAMIGMEFIMRLQVLAGSAVFFPRPELAIGGVTQSLESFDMRCDHDQHFLTACLTAMDVADLFWN